MHPRTAATIAAALVLMVLAFAVHRPGTAAAAPAGAAVNLQVTQSCLPNGLVRVSIAWIPSGWGTQWADLSLLNNDFAYGWWNHGPLAAAQSTIVWDGLQPNSVYYARINTWTGVWLPSDTIAFVTLACGAYFAPPFSLSAIPMSPYHAVFQWQAGPHSPWFCIDTALAAADLLTFTGTFRNHFCGTTLTQHTLFGLQCGTVYYWRVFGWGPFGSAHSPIYSFRTADCAFFSPPLALYSQVLSRNSVLLSWVPGANNIWYCVDVAPSHTHLVQFLEGWGNIGCGTTATSLTVSGLQCGTLYFWRVFASGVGVSGHSGVATFVLPCDSFDGPDRFHRLERAPIEHLSVRPTHDFHKGYVLQIIAALPTGCHEPHSYDVDRSGTQIFVEVLNFVAPHHFCTQVFRTYRIDIPLDLVQGGTYTIRVNNRTITFTAN